MKTAQELSTLTNKISLQFIDLLATKEDLVSKVYTLTKCYNLSDCAEGNSLLYIYYLDTKHVFNRLQHISSRIMGKSTL